MNARGTFERLAAIKDVLSDFEAAGYRILAPGELCPETLERAAQVADRQGNVYWDDGDGGQYGHGYENACGDVAIEIRSLKGDSKDG